MTHLHEALLYKKKDEKVVICGLCAHHCRLKTGEHGKCSVRLNIDGILYSLVYGKLVAQHVDPIEKKPLFHVLPGSLSYSISTVGCNFKCLHCQNSSISQIPPLHQDRVPGTDFSPERVVVEAVKNECLSISYTYVEPTIFFEFAFDCAVLAHEKGLKNVFVSNGFMTEKATQLLALKLDAINIDIKSFRDDFYREVCSARLRPVLETVKLMHDLGVWVEVTTLLIPGMNDSDQELNDIAQFIAGVNPSIPWHVTAFYPTYKMTDRPHTSVSSLRRARDIGLEAGLNFVYEGNVPGEGGENSFCPQCYSELINRYGFSVRVNQLQDGYCHQCNEKIAGIW